MKSLSLKEIAKALNISIDLSEDILVSSISTDTRDITEGALFVAIKGESFDGNKFIEKAFENGAVAAIGNQNGEYSRPVLCVDDSVLALGSIARYYKSKFNTLSVGVTGSVGKTSTREMVYAALSGFGKTLRTDGNKNNEIGLPKTVLSLDDSFEYAVFEMGMCGLGEIDYLTNIVKPDVAIITNIGISHIENLKTRENILKAKLEIENGLSENGVLILNSDNDLLHTTKGKLAHSCIYYGIEDESADVRAKDIKIYEDKTEFTIIYDKEYKAEVPAVGAHHVLNALAAFAVAVVLGLDKEKAVENLKLYETSGRRQRIYKEGDVTVIDDCYNASPDSMKASLGVLEKLIANRKIAVLGDMLELGSFSESGHREVGAVAAKVCDAIFCFGENAKYYTEEFKKQKAQCFWFEDKNVLSDKLSEYLKSGDIVLFKGSRGMKLEEVISQVFSKGDK